MHGRTTRGKSLVRRVPLLSIVLALLLLLTSCQFVQSGFAKTVGNAGAEFSAAATTLSYVHQGKLAPVYAASSFADYQNQLSGVDRQLSSQQDPPTPQTVHSLLTLYKPAMQAVNAPCLKSDCDWQGQVDALQKASRAFLKAAGQ